MDIASENNFGKEGAWHNSSSIETLKNDVKLGDRLEFRHPRN